MMTFQLDKSSDVPLYRQLGDAFLEKIRTGELTPGTRLPAIRNLAKKLEVNNTTLVSTYKFLETVGAVYSVRGSGVYVQAATDSTAEMRPPASGNYINFADMQISPALFPSDALKQAFGGIIAAEGAGAFAAVGGKCFAPLAAQVSELVAPAGIKCEASDIHIAASARAAVEAVADALISPGDTVLVESPTAQGIAAIFTSRGARVISAPIIKTLLDLGRLQEQLTRHKPRLMYINPSFQVPTGESYPDAVKSRLILMATASNTHIIEMDSYSDFYYRLRPTPVKAYDTANVVSYIKGFERTLAPGMGAYVITDAPVSPVPLAGLTQRGIAVYLRSGHYVQHLAFLRASYTLLFKRLATAVRGFLEPHASITIPEGGLGFWITPKGRVDVAKLCDRILQNGVMVSPGGLYDAPKSFRLSFANVREDKIAEGVGIIASVMGK
jgi:DNA-binding transcriptional MocR family regulator